jgi:TolB-like protein
MKPFETSGQVDPELAKSLWGQLAQSIERNSDFRIAAGGPAYYYLVGRISSDGKLQFVTLQLFKAKTDRALWIQNYDYRGMSADRMAIDVIEALSSVTRSDTWN